MEKNEIEPFKCRKCDLPLYIFEVYPPIGDPIEAGSSCTNNKCEFYGVLIAL